MAIYNEIKTKIYNNHSPYTNFQPNGYKIDLQGWNGRHPELIKVIQEIKPKSILELGSWKGQSSIFIANEVIKYQKDSCVVCVDTWYGSPEHWNYGRADKIYKDLNLEYGRANLYYQFLSNVILSNLQDTILPFPQTTLAAMAILKNTKTTFDMIYVDAGHDYVSVYQDLEAAWPLLNEKGILIGDDYTWTNVAKAVKDFTKKHGLVYTVNNPKYTIRK